VAYYDFMIGEEGQRILAARGFVPARRDMQGALAGQPLRLVDPALVLDQSEKWTRLYESIFLSQRR
jgi:iron(III) transport system substrate-binding protein